MPVRPPRFHRDPDFIYVFRARVTAVAIGVGAAAMGLGLAIVNGVSGIGVLFTMLVSGLVGGLVARYLITGVIDTASTVLARTVLPSGRSTPYTRTYSYEQSLAARGDTPGAVRAYAEAIARYPDDPEPCFQVAELLARSGEARASAEHFVLGRTRAAGDRARELYATQRLIDLHLGPLADPGRALVELRRLIERFPGTREALAARTALARIKGAGGDAEPGAG